jgi:hypothetical protein
MHWVEEERERGRHVNSRVDWTIEAGSGAKQQDAEQNKHEIRSSLCHFTIYKTIIIIVSIRF